MTTTATTSTPLPPHLQEELQQHLPSSISKEKAARIAEEVAATYAAAKINPGECVGLVAAESIGEPSTQMSIFSGEKIIVRNQDKISIVEIGPFIDSLMQLKGSVQISEDSEVLPLHDLEIAVPSLNQEEKVEWKKVIECSRHRSPAQLLKLVTASGRSITATDNHSFVIRQHNSIVPVEGRKLKVGDRIPVLNALSNPIALKEAEISDIPIKDSLIQIKETLDDPDIVFGEEDDIISKPGRKIKPIKNTIPLNWQTGWFMGAYLAEGSANGYQLGISNLNDIYIGRAREFVESTGLQVVEEYHHRGFALSRDLKVNSVLLSRFIIALCGQGSGGKHVPQLAYSASDEFIAGLLRGYFDGDGNFHADRDMIRISSNSKELTDGIALLLSRFRIFAYKTKDKESPDKKGQHWLLIPYKYAPQFLAQISSDIDYKRQSLEQMAEKAKKFWNEFSHEYTDMISGFDEVLLTAARKVGYPTRYVNNFTKRQKIGRAALYRYLKLFSNLAKEKNVDLSSEIAIMQRMFYSDVIWDEIVAMEYVPVGGSTGEGEDHENQFVYDLSVPGLETFTTFQGIITHNTLNTFHFAGVAEMNVTTGLPRIIEIFDATKEIKTPMMEVHFKKGYNDLDTVRNFAAQIKETMLGELVTEYAFNIFEQTLKIKLNQALLDNYSLATKDIAVLIRSKHKSFTVESSGEEILCTHKGKPEEIKELYNLKEKVKDIKVKGLKGIKQVLPVKREDGFIVLTSGTNLKEILEMKEVDAVHTTCNDIHEILKVLGVEAARQAVINEVFRVIEAQGLNIDVRHVMLVADLMCTSGKIKGVTRYGVVSEKASVLARASFETPVKHLINAALEGENDPLASVVENVMINQPVPLGTGLPGLVTKMK